MSTVLAFKVLRKKVMRGRSESESEGVRGSDSLRGNVMRIFLLLSVLSVVNHTQYMVVLLYTCISKHRTQ